MALASPTPLRRELERAFPERPFRVEFWDGTALPSTDGGPTVAVRGPAAIAHGRRSPGQLGVGRAYVSGALEIDDLDAVMHVLEEWRPAPLEARQKARL